LLFGEYLEKNLDHHYEKFLYLWKDADRGISEVEDAKDRLTLWYNKANSDNKGTVMKKLFIIFLVLIGCIGLISCASGLRQGDILYPVPTSDVPAGTLEAMKRPRSTGRISIEGFNEKEIVFKIWLRLPQEMWLEYVIMDEEENSISEESFYNDERRTYTRKMKAKEESIFRKGKNYTLHIGRKLPVSHPVYGRFQLLYSYKFVL